MTINTPKLVSKKIPPIIKGTWIEIFTHKVANLGVIHQILDSSILTSCPITILYFDASGLTQFSCHVPNPLLKRERDYAASNLGKTGPINMI